MGEIRIVGPGKTRGYPYPVCKKKGVEMCPNIFFDIRDTLRKHCLRHQQLTLYKAENHVTYFGYFVPVFEQDR